MLNLPQDHAGWADEVAGGHRTRILIGNDFSEDVRTDRGWTGWWVQRLVWFARDGDVLVLPTPPDEDFVDYVTSLTAVRKDSLSFVVPPAGGGDEGAASQGMLTPGRLADPEFVAELRKAVGGREVTHLSALWPDPAVSRLAVQLGVAHAMPGHGFAAQGGGLLVNSKSMFRAVAGGAGVPVPQGGVCTGADAAERMVLDLLEGGEAVVLKHDFLSGGRGNEILSADPTVRPVGARRVVPVTSPGDVRDYLADRWSWLTGGGRSRPVVERYHRDSSAYFAEYLISATGVHLGGTGELLSAPYAVGQVMPAQGLEPEVLEQLCRGAERLAQALHAIGYRGVLGPDAIVTPEREVLFTEFNGRVTGSTHIYGVIGRSVAGPGFGRDRIILERVWPEGWSTPSFAAAKARLTEAGLAYRPEERTGVVFTNAFDGTNGVMYCILAETPDQAWACDRAMGALFGPTPSASRP
ncbi:peptide ligase PGM1-related protein [Kitasatospora sp. RB6PN24]|uniref:preATP grasp domain-containing protein n=1 Tax=Kitasatospora humi TaxID=2893891 RepID=UPI001E526131|nr:peptide ligase PGM1-related protein [Kitasatospora humi]MCC9306036.1 peptide ligase PGM1-related protein [Kitasatospora humi]